MTTDADGRDRRGVYLPHSLWEWLEQVAERDGASRNDLLEGLVLLARDHDHQRGPKVSIQIVAGPICPNCGARLPAG